MLARLLAEFNAEFGTWAPPPPDLRRRFAALLAREDAVVTVSTDQPAAGFALVTLRPSPYYDGPVAALDELYVAPSRRGQGLGSALLALAVDAVLDLGGGEIQINVDEDDRDARRFYERHGFTNLESGSTERMLCYLRELRP